jgi:hypothetical protein
MKSQAGQVLLIAVLMIATVLTVTLTLTLKSTTETQLTKLEEESQKTLSAAEAAVEAAIQSGSNIALSDLSGFTNFEGGATLDTLAIKEFATPLLQRNQQYTFYLSNFPSYADAWTGNLTIYFESESGTEPALELTFIRQNNTIHRYVIDPHNKIDSNAGETAATSGNTTLGGFTFRYRVLFGITQPHKVLVVRVLNAQSRLGFKSPTGADLKIQGKTVTSEAKSTGTGVTKKIQLFQSYPQIPAEFFTTSF